MKDEISLCELAPGEQGKIIRILGNGLFKQRLMEMGLVKGQLIRKVKLAPLADPAEFVIKDYHVSLRREEAQEVMVSRLP